MTPKSPPRFVTRTMATTFATVVFILIAVLLVVTLTVRGRMRSSVLARLTTQQGMLSAREDRRVVVMQAQAETLAEAPTVKAAMDTYRAEAGSPDPEVQRQLVDTVAREIESLAQRIRPDI